TPHLYIINPQGQLVYAGGIDSIASARVDDIRTATNYVRQGLAEGMAGKPLSVATSRAYGCSVKYRA
ncbi:MAG: thioredoxin family protein, partial [Haliea sp.]